jgi:hypothetical protein
MTPFLALAAAAGASAVPPICTDRPTKANAVCTVPVGKLQLESSLASWSFTRAAGTRTRLMSLGSTAVKLGVTEKSDLQVGVTPYVRLEVEGSKDAGGFGDIVVRYKQRLTNDGASVQAAIIPFLKLPTAARGLGNDKAEGGLAIPVSFALSGPISMTFGPEVDLLADGDGHGRHAAIVNLINIAGPIAPRLTLAGEIWTNVNFDSAGTIKQASADAALTYSLSNNVQIDAGANIGLTRDTPDVELYAGASLRF